MSISRQDVKLKSFLICAGFLTSYCLADSLNANEVTSCKSPDGKFALHCVYADSQSYNGGAACLTNNESKGCFVCLLIWRTFCKTGRCWTYLNRLEDVSPAKISLLSEPE